MPQNHFSKSDFYVLIVVTENKGIISCLYPILYLNSCYSETLGIMNKLMKNEQLPTEDKILFEVMKKGK